jgi:hypothetical protein
MSLCFQIFFILLYLEIFYQFASFIERFLLMNIFKTKIFNVIDHGQCLYQNYIHQRPYYLKCFLISYIFKLNMFILFII